jgi:hypothetical protein
MIFAWNVKEKKLWLLGGLGWFLRFLLQSR